MPKTRIAILGSGATGVSVARALLDDREFDCEIDVIDYGYIPSDSRVLSKNRSFSEKDRHKKGYVLHVPEIFKTNSELEGNVAGSASMGGWAELWGASILRLSETELQKWPIKSLDLKESWENTERHIKFGNQFDNFFDENFERTVPDFIKSLNKTSLKSSSTNFQISNLAIRPISNIPENGCTLCGQCLIGCPWDHIWSATRDWKILLNDSRINYKSGHWIKEITEKNNQVTVISDTASEQNLAKNYNSVFVALGSIQTAALMLRSKIAISPVIIQDSQTIITPFILKNFKKTGDSTSRISLSDGFAFYPNRTELSNNFENFYAQIYGYSESLLVEIKEKIKITKLVPSFILRFFLRRVGIAMCYFDQSESGKIVVEIQNEITNVKPEFIDINKKLMRKKINKYLSQLGFLPLSFLAQITGVGSSYHSGASFPMTKNNNERLNFSDVLGRPNGLKNTYIVDTSVFSEISTTPNTFNAMANARRIALIFMKEK